MNLHRSVKTGSSQRHSPSPRWLASLVAKMLRVAPFETCLITTLTFVSQVSIVVSFILPLKVIVLMSSGHVPSYFPGFLREYDRDTLVLLMGGFAVGLYLVHFAADHVVDSFAAKGADKMAAHSSKLPMFLEQDGLTKSTYQKAARSLAGLIFAAIAMFLSAIVYPALTLFLVIAVLVIASCAFILAILNPAIAEYLNENSTKVIGIANQCTFFLSFGFMIYQFVTGQMPNAFNAVIGIILIRQILSRASSAIVGLNGLIRQRHQIDAVFFHSTVHFRPENSNTKALWSLIDSDQIRDWLPDLMSQAMKRPIVVDDIKWRETEQSGVLAFDVRTREGQSSDGYMVKIFQRTHVDKWSRELSLLTSFENSAALVPEFSGSGEVNEVACTIFRGDFGKKRGYHESIAALETVRPELWGLSPPGELIGKFRRSHTMAYQRLDNNWERKFRTVAGHRPEYSKDTSQFLERLPEISATLDGLPLIVVNPDLRSSLYEISGRFVASAWSRWSLEPIGAGSELGEDTEDDIAKSLDLALEEVGTTLDLARQLRPALGPVRTRDVLISSLMFTFVRNVERNRWQTALASSGPIIQLLDRSD